MQLHPRYEAYSHKGCMCTCMQFPMTLAHLISTAQFTTAQIPLILGTAKNLTVLTVEPEYKPLSCVGTGQLDMLYFC